MTPPPPPQKKKKKKKVRLDTNIILCQPFKLPGAEVLDARHLEGVSQNSPFTPEVQFDPDVSGKRTEEPDGGRHGDVAG